MKYLPVLAVMSAAAVLVASCKAARETMAEMMIESVRDPMTGTQVFSRGYDADPYGINVGKIAKARRDAKKERIKEQLKKY